MTLEIKRTERGWAGHYILGSRCRFHLNTLLEYKDIRIIVSTVGMMITGKEPEEIGCDRYYETMAFHTMEKEEFIEIDVERQVNFHSDWAISKPFKDNKANEMHDNVVHEIINFMKG